MGPVMGVVVLCKNRAMPGVMGGLRVQCPNRHQGRSARPVGMLVVFSMVEGMFCLPVTVMADQASNMIRCMGFMMVLCRSAGKSR